MTFFAYLPIVCFYTAQTTCVENIQAKFKDVTYVYLSLVKVKVDIVGIDILAHYTFWE